MSHSEAEVRAKQIIALRRRYNASGQDGRDIANIIAALVSDTPASGAQLNLF